MCLLLSSWIPAVVTCKSRSEERHITEMIFLPQIFNNSTLLSLFFIPFGFLPLTSIPCLAFCAITTVSERPSRIQSVKTLMIYCDGIFAIIYYTSAYFMGKYVNSFVESFHLECTVQTRYWTIATIIAYSIGLLCTVTVLLLITTRPTESSKKQKDEPLANEYLARSRESLQQASSASISTAHSASTDSKHNTIELSPEPFIVNSSSGILNLRNVYSNDWAAIRILSNNSELSIHPTKFLLPPGRMSATEVTLKNQLNGELSSRLLVQWYIIGEDCPARNVNALWTRPYCVPRPFSTPMDLIMVLLGFLVSGIPLSITCLYLLSWLTPWPIRTRKELMQPLFAYTPDNPESEKFMPLLVDDESGQLHCTKPDLYLSIIIPAMNEQERLPVMLNECLSYLEDRQNKDDLFTYEVIVVDDGSTDRTADTGYRYTEKCGRKIRVLKLEKNLGKGGAVRSGVLCARGSLILFADADGATKFADFEHVEEKLLNLAALESCKKRDSLDWVIPAIAIGSRAHMEKKSIATRSLVRTFLMMGFHLMVYIFTVRTVRDTQCGFKLFTRGAVCKLFPLLHIERWAFDVELLFLAEQFNIPIIEVPVTWHEVDGSKIVPIVSWIQMGRDLILIWFRYTAAESSELKINWIFCKTMPESPKRFRRRSERSMENRLIMKEERVLNTYDANSDFTSISMQWNVETYISNVKISVINESKDGMALEFDLIGVESPIANAIRRVLIAEDEVLSHRFGLLPIKADPRLFKMPLTRVIGVNESGVDCDEEPVGDPERNLIFEIKVTCAQNPNALKTATNPKEIYDNAFVYSNAFKWIPIGDQSTSLPYSPTMVHGDILVAQLRPGQEIEARCHCTKGIGRDHAKFSPVATASYRLLPKIILKKKFSGADAQRVMNSFSEGVIEINADGVAVVRDARSDTCSRNVLRHEDLAEHIELSRMKDHFIFSVESTGAIRSAELLVEACKVLEEKCQTLRTLLRKRLKEV
uniref:Dolichyl-phosphate beta-glucosyltransferase n=1 Tax=Setaria digitata TaxID=48799 RepID=A0A915Q6A0_9BILA